jgi:glycosyltransferase involved in cell wall biosynthesis
MRLTLAGPDDGHERELRALIGRLDISDAVTFGGFLNPARRIQALVDADVTVVPSRHEVFALTAVESLMCGTPVVLSSACGLFPKPGPLEGVVLFQSGDPGDLAGQLIRGMELHSDKSRWKDYVIRNFSIESVARRAEAIYRGI